MKVTFKRTKVLRAERTGEWGEWWLELACGHKHFHYTYSTRPIKTAVCDKCTQQGVQKNKTDAE